LEEQHHTLHSDASEAAEVAASFRRREDVDRDELDMTPMIDVTFLLLIFFMVTAAFSLQKSLEVPTPDQQENAAETRSLEEIEEDDDYIVVRIAADNTMFVDGIAAPTEQELLLKLREARAGLPGTNSTGPANLLVLAHDDCRHETVVTAIDAGNAVGMQSVRLASGGEEDF